MAKFIVTANKLNRRRVVPASLPDPNNIIDVVRKNFIFEAEEVSEDEMPSTVHDKWFKDRNGFFYWGGGINELRTSAIDHIEKTDYRTLMTNIPSQWLATGGRGIKVAILDTGFFMDHQDLIHMKNTAIVKDFGGNNNTEDRKGHGTHILGLLGAKTSVSDGIMGLIPEAKFFLYKVVRDGVGFLDVFVEQAIDDAVTEEVDLINMSFNVPSNEGSSLHKAIKKAFDKNIFIVASSGENDNLIQNSLVFPAQFERVISVGETDSEFAQSSPMNFNSQLDFIMPFVDQRSCWINDSFGMYRSLKGSSMATSLVTGVLASSMSFKNKNNNPVDDLKAVTSSFSVSIFNDSTLKIVKP
jgi:subtilisin family serine protease